MLIAITNLPFLLLTILPNPESYYWLAIFVASAVFYSAPPLRAKTKPILDTIVSAFVYIAPGYV
jgi:4-hydroxybenzoate polyprenyltransferase